MKVPSIFMGVVLLAIFVAMVAIAWSYPAGARFQPFVIGIPAIALCILQIVLDIMQRNDQAEGSGGGNEFARAEAEIAKATGRKVEFEVAHQDMPKEETLSEEGELGREIVVWLYILGFIGACVAFGFWIGIPAFLFLFLATYAGTKIPKAFLMAAIGTAIFYSAFEIVLKVKVFEGFFGPLIWEQVAQILSGVGIKLRL